MARDKITPLSGPPGHSLTDEPGRWPWDRPPIYPNPDDAIDYVTDMTSDEPARENILKMLLAGITVEEMVAQISFKGFMAGFYTPDVAELIKPAIAIHLADMAEEEGFEPIMFTARGPDEDEITDEKFFRILRQRNPDMFNKMNEEINRQHRMEISSVPRSASSQIKTEQEVASSFLNVEGSDQ